MMWSVDPNVDAARKHAGWQEFHRAAGRVGVFFDHMVRESRRGQYTCDAFTTSEKLATGRGATVIASVADAYAKAGRTSPDADQWLVVLTGVAADDFDELLVDDFEELM